MLQAVLPLCPNKLEACEDVLEYHQPFDITYRDSGPHASGSKLHLHSLDRFHFNTVIKLHISQKCFFDKLFVIVYVSETIITYQWRFEKIILYSGLYNCHVLTLPYISHSTPEQFGEQGTRGVCCDD